MDPILSLDRILFDFMNRAAAGPAMDALMGAVTHLGEAPWIFLFALIPLAWKGGSTGRKTATLLVPLVLATDASVAHLWKPLFARVRPFAADPAVRLLFDGGGLSDFSFPSGHAANTAAAVTFVALVYRRTFVFAAAALAIVLVDASRVYMGVHYPIDVAAGSAYGALLAWATFMATRRWLRKEKSAECGVRSAEEGRH